ncbi:MAG: hypothetical protein AABZ47_03500 [Planctomycetota bacterium]
MIRQYSKLIACMFAGGFLALELGCEQQEPPKPSPASSSAPSAPAQPQKPTPPVEEKKPPVTPPLPSGAESSATAPKALPAPPATQSTPPSAGSSALDLGGVSITIPAGWAVEPIAPGPMAAKFAYRLPKADGETEDGIVRISHYANMKGMDEANIGRWISQVKRADGQPATKDDAKITVNEKGSIRITLVDISGAMSGGMGTGQAGGGNQRAINAIIDHPAGPHFLRASGGVATMAKWEASIRAAIESAKPGQ